MQVIGPQAGKLQGLQGNINKLMQTLIAQKLKKQEDERSTKSSIQEKIAGGIAYGHTRPKDGADINNLSLGDLEPILTQGSATKMTPKDLEVIESINALQAESELPQGMNVIPEKISNILKYIPGVGPIANAVGQYLGNNKRGGMVEDRISAMNQPYYQKYRDQFGGNNNNNSNSSTVTGDPKIDALIQQYYSTDDPDQLKKIEQALTELGIQFE